MMAPEEIADLRDTGGAALSGVCDITRKQRVRQPNGAWKDTQVPVSTGVPCRKIPTGQTPEERVLLDNTTLANRGVSTFLLTGDYDVYKDDVIIYPQIEGKQYGVIGVYWRTDGEYIRVLVYDDSAAPKVS